jgi:hypothetical protein
MLSYNKLGRADLLDQRLQLLTYEPFVISLEKG